MAHKETVLSETLTGTRVLTAAEVQTNGIIAFDPGGAGRNVDLPATTNLAGQRFVIVNTADAGETLTVRLTGAGATIATVDQNENATLICHNSAAGSWVAQVGKAT